MIPRRTYLLALALAALLGGGAAPQLASSAEEPPAAVNDVSKADREKMASMHERMASCLRSDKSMQTCHAEMQATCQTMMQGQECPMMGMGMRRGVHMDDSSMKRPPPDKPDAN